MARRNLIRAYGDRQGDGMVQLSFVLPVDPSEHSREMAKHFAELHGLKEPLVATMESAAPGHAYFVVYGRSVHGVDPAEVEAPEVSTADYSHQEIEELAASLGRKIVVVGACTGHDAHTVGIDAILNYKGYAGDKGLESYRCFETHNLGAQVENLELIRRARELGADAILVSQVITQRNCHKENGKALIDELEKMGLRQGLLLLLGGPRIDQKLALELGFDAGFGHGTTPARVASLIVDRLCKKPA